MFDVILSITQEDEFKVKGQLVINQEYSKLRWCLNKDDIKNADIQNFDCVLITGTSLAAEPSRSATLYALDIANKNNIPVIMDIDYRPYTCLLYTSPSPRDS